MQLKKSRHLGTTQYLLMKLPPAVKKFYQYGYDTLTEILIFINFYLFSFTQIEVLAKVLEITYWVLKAHRNRHETMPRENAAMVL